MRILFSTSSLFPYRVNWLDELGKYAHVDVYYLMDSDAARNTQWCAQRPQNCRYTLQKSRMLPKLGLISLDLIRVLRDRAKDYDVIILDGYGFASQLLSILYLNSRKLTYYVNIDGMVPKDKENGIVRLLKRQIISRFPYCLCGARATNTILADYGVSPERIINHPFTSLNGDDLAQMLASDCEKTAIRQKLGIPEKKMIVSVGRFSYMNGYGKGYDVLMRSAKQMYSDIGWYIIGGQPTEEFARMKKEMKLDNIHFVDFMEKDALAQYYRAADVFVLMTVGDVWGLVINEAMANGLPVITTDKCVAGLDLVRDGENGYIVPVGDETALKDRLTKILDDPALMKKMAHASLEKIEPYTIENMARIHMEAFCKNLEG